jgi:hypothetical protein
MQKDHDHETQCHACKFENNADTQHERFRSDDGDTIINNKHLISTASIIIITIAD